MTDKGKKSCVFGPVYSRRLGRSLGVDLVPLKTCTYDCVYCQVGHTTDKTVERREYVNAEKALAEIDAYLRENSEPDYITFSGSGEPTLHAGLGKIISGIRRLTETPVAVLTNGSLLWMPEVREACAGADLVIPSLDAANEKMFQRINRPHDSLAFEKTVDGLIAFRNGFTGKYRLEIMLLGGVSNEEISALAAIVKRIKPDAVEVNSPVRPPAEESAVPIPATMLREIAARIHPDAVIIGRAPDTRSTINTGLKERTTALLSMLERRPCTLADITRGLGIPENEAEKLLEELESSGHIYVITRENVSYFVNSSPGSETASGNKDS
jgi:wyosine [tRNA(Phe)-imidazoG37] synthetase (radical SAM superfamily)